MKRYDHLLNILYQLTLLEETAGLTDEETTMYLYCYDTLTQAGIDINFGIEI